MKNICITGFIYDDFGSGDFIPIFITSSQNKAIQMLKTKTHEREDYEVREYLMDTEIDYDDFKKIAYISRDKKIMIQINIQENIDKAKKIIDKFMKNKERSQTEIYDDEWSILNEQIYELYLPLYEIEKLYEEVW